MKNCAVWTKKKQKENLFSSNWKSLIWSFRFTNELFRFEVPRRFSSSAFKAHSTVTIASIVNETLEGDCEERSIWLNDFFNQSFVCFDGNLRGISSNWVYQILSNHWRGFMIARSPVAWQKKEIYENFQRDRGTFRGTTFIADSEMKIIFIQLCVPSYPSRLFFRIQYVISFWILFICSTFCGVLSQHGKKVARENLARIIKAIKMAGSLRRNKINKLNGHKNIQFGNRFWHSSDIKMPSKSDSTDES